MSIPEKEPTQITAGDALTWKRLASDCLTPAGDQCRASDNWVLTYVFVNQDKQIQIAAAADGDDHKVDVAPAVSADYKPGQYSWQANVEKGAERYNIASGLMEIRPDFAALEQGYDDRNHIKRTLDAIEATIENRATKDQAEMVAGNNEVIARQPLHRLLELRKQYKAAWDALQNQEAVERGEGNASNILVRFNDV